MNATKDDLEAIKLENIQTASDDIVESRILAYDEASQLAIRTEVEPLAHIVIADGYVNAVAKHFVQVWEPIIAMEPNAILATVQAAENAHAFYFVLTSLARLERKRFFIQNAVIEASLALRNLLVNVRLILELDLSSIDFESAVSTCNKFNDMVVSSGIELFLQAYPELLAHLKRLCSSLTDRDSEKTVQVRRRLLVESIAKSKDRVLTAPCWGRVIKLTQLVYDDYNCVVLRRLQSFC